MLRARIEGLAVLLLLPVLLLGAECNGDSTDVEITADFVGNWNATSFVIDGEELIVPGGQFYLSVGFFGDGSYQLIAGGDDMSIVCDGVTSCVDSGDFSFGGTVITLDPGTVDESTFTYSIDGDTLTLSGDTAFGPFTAVFERI